MRKLKQALLAAAGLCVVLCGANLMAVTAQVGNCRALPAFPTIQAAVNAVPAGSTIFVCPGAYPEQIVIAKNLTLRGAQPSSANSGSGAVIKSPAAGLTANTTSLSSGAPLAAHVLVQDASVSFTNLTIDSSHNGAGCTPVLIGLFYRNASGIVSNSAFLNQIADSNDGCDSGLSVFVQSGLGGSSRVKIFNNAVQNYQRNGITGNDGGTNVTISGNTVAGRGPTNGAANNGIQIGFGATGTITGNTAIDDIWEPDTLSDPGDAATGILIFDSSHVSVRNNTVGNTQFGIGVGSDSAGHATGNNIIQNVISATRIFDGIDVCANRNLLLGNIINGSDEAGIHLDSRCVDDSGVATGHGNIVVRNTINSACAGILIGAGATPNNLAANSFFNVGTAVLNGEQCAAAAQAPAAQASLARPRSSAGRPQFRPAHP